MGGRLGAVFCRPTLPSSIGKRSWKSECPPPSQLPVMEGTMLTHDTVYPGIHPVDKGTRSGFYMQQSALITTRYCMICVRKCLCLPSVSFCWPLSKCTRTSRWSSFFYYFDNWCMCTCSRKRENALSTRTFRTPAQRKFGGCGPRRICGRFFASS